jgi:hypothetical protein
MKLKIMQRRITKRSVVGVAVTSVLIFGSESYLAAQEIQTETQGSGATEGIQSPQDANSFKRDSRVVTGYRITPVGLDVRRKDRALVGLGSYLVNAAGGCNDCHTNPPFAAGGDPFKGESEIINSERFLAGGRAFGPIIAPNITPDEHGRPAGLTFDEFESLMRTGTDEESGRILQVMPWNVYGKLTRQDLRAMYEYLRAIPAVPTEPAPQPSPDESP